MEDEQEATKAALVDTLDGPFLRITFRHYADNYYRGSWQDRAVGMPPRVDASLSYYNSSKTAANSNVLQVILRVHGFSRTEQVDDDWNIFWCAGQPADIMGGLLQVDPQVLRGLKAFQLVNKFPKASSLTLKSNLWSNFQRMQRKFGRQHFDYMPATFLVPLQLDQLETCLQSAEYSETVWIVKPAAAYCGRGISLHRTRPSLADDLRSQKGVCSVYIDPPFLLNGLKSDIRLYVLVHQSRGPLKPSGPVLVQYSGSSSVSCYLALFLSFQVAAPLFYKNRM
eukprot:6195544-Pleurochrysis_carterae.AAC.3